MNKLPMCRICLVENVRMYVVVNKNLHELYEKMTGIAPNPSMNIDHLEFCSGFSTRQIELISIVDGCQTESIAVNEELPAVCERQDDIIEPKEEYLSDDQEPQNLENKGPGKRNMLPRIIFESDLECDVPLLEFETELEEEQVVSQKKRRAEDTNRASATKKPKLNTQRSKLEDTVTAELEENEQSNMKDIRTTQNCTSNCDTNFNKYDKCDQRGLNQVKHFNQHTRTGISEKLHKCDVCQHSFCTKSNLTKHILTHTCEKPFKCDICQRSFTIKCNLKRHFRIHTGEKPFKCDICQRSFSQKQTLTAHIRIHTDEKPFKCDVCPRSFRHKSVLNAHIRTHTGEKPFNCNVCQRRFTQKQHLTSHSKTHR